MNLFLMKIKVINLQLLHYRRIFLINPMKVELHRHKIKEVLLI